LNKLNETSSSSSESGTSPLIALPTLINEVLTALVSELNLSSS